MVKGNTRQVVVVKSPDEKLFEQAIFLLREDALSAGGVSDAELLRQAKAACKEKGNKYLLPWQKLLWFLSGSSLCALVWLLTVVFRA